MNNPAIYFFAESTLDYAMWTGLSDILREVKPSLPLVLIRTKRSEATQYTWETVLDRFDEVHEVDNARYQGDWNPRGIYSAFRHGFPQARKVESQLKKFEFNPNSTAFVFSGLSLNQSLFLKRVQAEKSVRSVLITLMKPKLTVDEFSFQYTNSLFRNMYLNYFGTAFIDVYQLRVTEGENARTRDTRYRNKPADLVVTGILPYRAKTPESGQIYCPVYQRNKLPKPIEQTILVIGAPFHYEPHLNIELCIKRFNELLRLIQEKHVGSRLIYKPHPGESSQQLLKLNLNGMKIDSSASVEELVMKDPSINLVYAFNSISVYTAASLGVRGYFLYPLFDERCIPNVIRKAYDTYLEPGAYPEMLIKSVDNWMSGKNDYEFNPITDQIRTSTIRMLETAGVLSTNERMDLIGELGSTVIPEERWHPMPKVRTLRGFLYIGMMAFLTYLFWTFPKRTLLKLLN